MMVDVCLAQCVCSIWKTWSTYVGPMEKCCIEWWNLTAVLVPAELGRMAMTVCGTTLTRHCLCHVTSAFLSYMVWWRYCCLWTSHAMLTCSSLRARLLDLTCCYCSAATVFSYSLICLQILVSEAPDVFFVFVWVSTQWARRTFLPHNSITSQNRS